jgi:hypothetical protein
MKKDKTIYCPTREKAQAVIETLPPFKASRFSNGIAEYKIVEYGKGFAIQLGDYGNYHLCTTADMPADAQLEKEVLS